MLKRETYHFRAEDGSVFVVHPGGFVASAKREYVQGPRKGQTEKITDEEVQRHRKQAEAEFGRYIPGSLLKEPRFIPGKQRQSLPLIGYKNGIPREEGWIDEKGVHHYPVLGRGWL
jgi:predicted NUDIX family NTP pyrophosphohydrolase